MERWIFLLLIEKVPKPNLGKTCHVTAQNVIRFYSMQVSNGFKKTLLAQDHINAEIYVENKFH